MDPGMQDPGFPGQHTTTTGPMGGMAPNIHFDPTYIKTIPGILKAVQLLLNLIGYICAMVCPDHSSSNWFSFVSMTAFWVTGILLVLYLMHILERFPMVPWLMLEFGYCAVFTFFYLTCASATAASGADDPAFGAAAFFGFAAMIAYGVDTFFKFKAWRGGEMAQGSQQVEMGQGDMVSPGAY
ncbi:unnamed protein product [Meganyctiphanes norvegica]|uniref:MARVEL domain-containing protein n=1 Tax=Meganyctiphanes norvegica TaxID=48144 RepID=A0AAV2QLK5_MEGNR